MWRFLLPLGLFGALIAFFYVGLGRDKETLPSALLDKPAPQFELPRVDDPNLTVSSREFAGQMYALNVWGTWCGGCRQEHPVLMEIARRNVIPIIGLDWKDDRTAALNWLRDLGDPYVANAFDAEGRTAIDWGVYGAPETFLVNEDGIVVHKHVGPLTMEVWEQDFMPKITKQGGATE